MMGLNELVQVLPRTVIRGRRFGNMVLLLDVIDEIAEVFESFPC